MSDQGFELLFLRVKLIFRLPAQSSLLVKIVPEVQTRHFLLSGDAKRLANIGILFRRDAPDSLQRSGASATVLSATAFALAAAAGCIAATSHRPFPARGFASGADLCAGGWSQAGEQNVHPSIRRGFPLSVGIGAFSRSVELAPILAAIVPSHHPAIGSAARSSARRTGRGFARPFHALVRSGCGRAYPLWAARESAAGLQSEKERTSLLSSTFVFRGPWTGVLARLAATGRQQCQHRRARFSGAALSPN